MEDELNLDELEALATEYAPGEVSLHDWDVPEWGFNSGGCLLSFVFKSDAEKLRELLIALPRLIAELRRHEQLAVEVARLQAELNRR